jgi:hypothetical protein
MRCWRRCGTAGAAAPVMRIAPRAAMRNTRVLLLARQPLAGARGSVRADSEPRP